MTYENQGGVEVLVVLLDVVCIILSCLLLVHRVEIEVGVVVLDGLEKRSESILEATFVQWHVVEAMWDTERTTLDRFVAEGCQFHPLRPFSPFCPCLP